MGTCYVAFSASQHPCTWQARCPPQGRALQGPGSCLPREGIFPITGHTHLPDEALLSDRLWLSRQMTWVLDKHNAQDVINSQLTFVSHSPFTVYSVGEAPL